MNRNKKILICPLNWGLGHASRIIPIIKLLQEYNHQIIIGAYGNGLDFLRKELPESDFIELKGIKVKYSKQNSQLIKMLFMIPKLIYWLIYEHKLLKKIVKQYSIDVVISDNRFGLWNKNVISIFITHQLRVKFPGILRYCEFIYSAMLKRVINKYNECWIPDNQGANNLSGELSHIPEKYNNIFFVGLLSRFKRSNKLNEKEEGILFVLSGPEPQRTIFENVILTQNFKNLKITLVRGTTEPLQKEYTFPIYNIVNTKKLEKLINISEMVICRAGYSSVMDLIALNKKAVLIPTPGQTEQEYLARNLKEKGLFYSMTQDKFEIQNAIANCYERPSFKNDDNRILLERIKMLNK